MKLTLIALATASLLSSGSVMASDTSDTLIDRGAFATPETEAFKAQLQKRADKKFLESASALANASGEPAMIDVGVVMHSSWIEAMKEHLTKDAAGKYYENGAQFAVARIKAQFDYFNETLAQQNVNARVRPVYYASVDSQTEASGQVTQSKEFSQMLVCVFYDESNASYPGLKDLCASQGLKRVRDIIQGQVDLIYYVREALPANNTLGLGTYFSGASNFDLYRATVKANIDAGVTEERLEDFRFGFVNANIFSHEFGHVMGAQHEVSESEPVFADGADNRAYACGIRVSGTPRVDNDLESRRKTVMWHLTGDHHRFFSDADIVVDGDRCGVRGEANNIDTVRKNAPSIANNFTLKPATSNVVFVQDAIVVGRQEGKATIMLRRTGDLSKAAYLSMTAKDGTAWENRDFTFGLKEIAFAAGESEKSVDVTLLSRATGHPDTKFNLVFQAAMGATYAATEAEVTILSDKAIQAGKVQFDKASVDIEEGATAQVQINRLNGTDGEITFKVTPANGTAINGTDYSAATMVKTMKDGEGSVIVEVSTIKRAGVQGDRTVNLSISEVAGGAELGQIGQATLNIKDAVDKGTLDLSAAKVSVNENGTLTLTINRTNGTDGAVTVLVQSVNGTAMAGTDFAAVDQVVTIPAGQSSATVTIAMINRTGTQGDRYFDVQLSEATGGAVLGSISKARVTVKDVAASGTLEFSTASVSVNENGSASLTINRTNGTEGEVSVRVQSVNGTAIAGTDFTGVDQVVTIPAGQASATVSIAMINRTGSQGARYFDVQLSGATGGATLGSAATARVNIADVATSTPVDNGSSGGGSGGSMGIFSLLGMLMMAVRRFKSVK